MEDRPPEAPVPPASHEAPSPGAPPARPPIPWEESGRDFVSGFFATVKLLYSKPREAFERMPLTSDVLRPYLFALIAGWIGVAAGVIWRTILMTMLGSLSAMAGVGDNTNFLKPMIMGPVSLIWAPFAIVVGVLVFSLFYHLFLMMFGAAKSGFAATLRVVCYAQAAVLLQIIPACGPPAGAIMSLVFTIIGFSAVHRVSNGRAAAAVLLPGILCCVLATWLVLLAGGAAWLTHFHPNMQP